MWQLQKCQLDQYFPKLEEKLQLSLYSLLNYGILEFFAKIIKYNLNFLVTSADLIPTPGISQEILAYTYRVDQ